MNPPMPTDLDQHGARRDRPDRPHPGPPRRPDTAYGCAAGRITGPQEERGVFRTTDGGRNWRCVLFVASATGCSGIAMDPKDPPTLIAGTWGVMHTWTMFSGGPGSGIFVKALREAPKSQAWSKSSMARAPSCASWRFPGARASIASSEACAMWCCAPLRQKTRTSGRSRASRTSRPAASPTGESLQAEAGPVAAPDRGTRDPITGGAGHDERGRGAGGRSADDGPRVYLCSDSLYRRPGGSTGVSTRTSFQKRSRMSPNQESR